MLTLVIVVFAQFSYIEIIIIANEDYCHDNFFMTVSCLDTDFMMGIIDDNTLVRVDNDALVGTAILPNNRDRNNDKNVYQKLAMEFATPVDSLRSLRLENSLEVLSETLLLPPTSDAVL